MLAALACVHYVVIFDDDTPNSLLHAIRPDVLVKGGTYSTDQIVGHEIVEAYGGKVCVTQAQLSPSSSLTHSPPVVEPKARRSPVASSASAWR